MAIEDFFTVTEIKNGLTSSDRVKDLVNLMLDERENAGENTTKHRSTIATTIAATNDKDCLNILLKLNGVSIINKWLEDAQNLDNEESIISLLNAVEKLCIGYEKSADYGIRSTLEKLIGHSSIMVQEKAKAVFVSWKKVGDSEVITNLEVESGQTMPSVEDVDTNIGITHEERDLKNDYDIENHINNEEKDLIDEKMKDEGIIMKKPIEESLCNEGEQSLCHLEVNPINSTSTAVVPKEDGMVSNKEVARPSDKLDEMEISPSPIEKDSEPATENNLQTNSDINIDNNLKESPTDDMRVDMPSSSRVNNAINVDKTPSNNSETMEMSQNPYTYSSREDSDSTSSHHSTSESDEMEKNQTDFLKNKTKNNLVVGKNMSDFELNYGIIDAMEVARQVANEVEREVEGRRETSCSSSQKNLETETQTESESKNNSPEKEEILNGQTDPIVDSSRAESKPEKGIIDFDLNQDISSDDTDQALDTTSTHVSIVSASRAAAAPGLPVTPLQFDGAHGWKGSAATSAFRPASPRKLHDSDNSNNNSKIFLDFDLNMCEDGDDKSPDLLPKKQILHSGESSGEARLGLDLNRISDEGEAPLPPDYRFSERIFSGINNHYNASPSSSSSSMQHPLRNFDLNDQPSFLNETPELNFFANLSSSQKSNPYPNVISIMGTKVEVDKKDIFPQPPFLPNGRFLEPTLDINRGGILGIGNPGIFTYNGLATGPTFGSTGTLSPILYGPGGPVPYLGSQAHYSQPLYTGIYGMHPPGFNGPGTGPSRPNSDLNLGLMGERVNRESGGFRQFLGNVQNFQPSSSGGIGKRKEPDGGWEPYQFDYKHHQWK